MALRLFVMIVFSFFVTVKPLCVDESYVSKKGQNCPLGQSHSEFTKHHKGGVGFLLIAIVVTI